MTQSLPPVQAADREALQLVLKQAEDEDLWFKAETAAEAYLQQELRRLHAAIEADRLAPQVAPGWKVERTEDLIQLTAPHGGRWCLIRDDDKTKIGSFLFDYFASQAKAGAPQPAGEAEPVATIEKGPWKAFASEYLPYHPSASQITPEYRDGWNACWRMTYQIHPTELRGGVTDAAGEGWISVKDRVPDEGVDALVRVQMTGGQVRHAVAGRFRGYEDLPADWYSFEQPERELEVTHWMPLPSAPTASGSGSGSA